MATYTRNNLAKLIINQQYDAESAAQFYGVSTKFILSEQETDEYRRIARLLLKSNRDNTRIESARTSTEIAERLIDEIDIADFAGIQDFEIINAQQGIAKTIYRQYNNFLEPKSNFRMKWYNGIQGVNERREMFGDERPINISFEPETPEQDQLKRLVGITFTPVIRGLHIADIYLE